MNERIKIITDRYIKCYQELIKARKRIKELENEQANKEANCIR